MRTRRNDIDFAQIIAVAITVVVIGMFAGVLGWVIYNESNHLTEGIVVDKDYSPAHTTYIHTSNKTVVPEYHAANYSMKLQGQKDGETVTYWRTVTELEYHAVDIGDYYPPVDE